MYGREIALKKKRHLAGRGITSFGKLEDPGSIRGDAHYRWQCFNVDERINLSIER